MSENRENKDVVSSEGDASNSDDFLLTPVELDGEDYHAEGEDNDGLDELDRSSDDTMVNSGDDTDVHKERKRGQSKPSKGLWAWLRSWFFEEPLQNDVERYLKPEPEAVADDQDVPAESSVEQDSNIDLQFRDVVRELSQYNWRGGYTKGGLLTVDLPVSESQKDAVSNKLNELGISYSSRQSKTHKGEVLRISGDEAARLLSAGLVEEHKGKKFSAQLEKKYIKSSLDRQKLKPKASFNEQGILEINAPNTVYTKDQLEAIQSKLRVKDIESQVYDNDVFCMDPEERGLSIYGSNAKKAFEGALKSQVNRDELKPLVAKVKSAGWKTGLSEGGEFLVYRKFDELSVKEFTEFANSFKGQAVEPRVTSDGAGGKTLVFRGANALQAASKDGALKSPPEKDEQSSELLDIDLILD